MCVSASGLFSHRWLLSRAAFEREIEGMPSTRSIGDLPRELRCPICQEVMKDAVLSSKCCLKSFCDKCKSVLYVALYINVSATFTFYDAEFGMSENISSRYTVFLLEFVLNRHFSHFLLLLRHTGSHYFKINV